MIPMMAALVRAGSRTSVIEAAPAPSILSPSAMHHVAKIII
jgi:hypothetical protein